MKTFIFILLTMLITIQAQAIGYKCRAYLGSSIVNSTSDHTSVFTAYINKLFEEQIVPFEQLLSLVEKLERSNKLINPIPHKIVEGKIVFVNSDDQIHFESLQEYIESGELDHNKILQWAQNLLKRNQAIGKGKQEASKQTSIARTEMAFFPIPPGEFMHPDPLKELTPRKVILTHETEVMSTKVTEYMWAQVMSENFNDFVENNKTILDFPKNNVSWWSVAEYANRLSIRHNLPPVYDFSEMTFDETTSPEKGDWRAKTGKLKINAPEENIYLAKGYRLPTNAESTWLRYLSQPTNNDFGIYEWLRSGAPEMELHGVREKQGYIIAGNPFYDIHGLLREFSNNWYHLKFHRLEGKNPQGAKEADEILVANQVNGQKTSYGSNDRLNRNNEIKYDATGAVRANSGSPEVGFRLVRTVKPDLQDREDK